MGDLQSLVAPKIVPGLQSNSQQELVAVFVDDDNFFKGMLDTVKGYNWAKELEDLQLIIDYCSTNGHVVSARIFAVPPFIKEDRVNSYFQKGLEFVPVPLFNHTNGKGGKSLADPLMICEVMTILHTRPEISTFVLVTGDKDFVPLITAIRRHTQKKNVIVIAPLSSSADMIKTTCDSLGYTYMCFEDLKAAYIGDSQVTEGE